MRYLPKYVVVLSLAVFFNIANAGGSYFSAQITDIKTISNKEYILTLKINDAHIWQYDEFKSCENINWIIDYQEWEIFHKIILTLKNIVTLNYSKRQLNATIETLKNDNNKNYTILTMGSSGSFQINPKNHCQIFSKTLIISKQKIDNTIVLEPIRHRSEMVNKK